MNICRTVMNSPVMERSLGRMSDEEREAAEAEKTSEDYVDFSGEYQFIDDELRSTFPQSIRKKALPPFSASAIRKTASISLSCA